MHETLHEARLKRRPRAAARESPSRSPAERQRANYQWTTGHTTHDVAMDVDLPARLAHWRLRLDRYLVDSTTSNDAHDPASSDAQLATVAPRAATATPITRFRTTPPGSPSSGGVRIR